jgi:hypothetical protein
MLYQPLDVITVLVWNESDAFIPFVQSRCWVALNLCFALNRVLSIHRLQLCHRC